MASKPIAALIVFALLTLAAFTGPSRAQTAPRGAAQACQALIPSGAQAFVGCWSNQMMSAPQQRVVTCYAQSGIAVEFVACVLGVHLSQDQANAVSCASQNGGDEVAIAECLGRTYLGSGEQRAIECLQQDADVFGFGACIASGQYLTPEQQVVVQCALQTGGEPISLTTCVGGQLTMNELSKCLSIGIGGRGCFGDNNTATALVSNAWHGISHGSSSSNTGVTAMRNMGRDFFSQPLWSWLLGMAFNDGP